MKQRKMITMGLTFCYLALNEDRTSTVAVITLLGSLMGVNTASKVDTDSVQLEFTTILDKHTIEDKDSDVPVKFSEPAWRLTSTWTWWICFSSGTSPTFL